MQRGQRALLAVLVAIGLLAAGCGDPPSHGVAASKPFVVAHVPYAGVQHPRYRYGPIAIHRGRTRSSFTRRRRSRTSRATSRVSVPT
jgi:hypothetical protein